MNDEDYFTAAEANDISTLQAFLTAQPQLISAKDEDRGWTALHYAAEFPEIVDLLLSKGADPNARASLGETPLHLASLATAEKLLRAGANPEAEDSEGLTTLFWAREEGDGHLFDLLASYSGHSRNYQVLKLVERNQDRLQADYRGELHIFQVVSLQDETCQAMKELPKPAGSFTYQIAELENLGLT